MPLCPPEAITNAATTDVTTMPPTNPKTSADMKTSVVGTVETSTIIDDDWPYNPFIGPLPRPYGSDFLTAQPARDPAFMIPVMISSVSPPQQPHTVTVHVLIKGASGNKSIAVVASLLLCAIILGLFWLGMRMLSARINAKTSSTSGVVTDTGNKTTGNIVPDVVTDKPADVGDKV